MAGDGDIAGTHFDVADTGTVKAGLLGQGLSCQVHFFASHPDATAEGNGDWIFPPRVRCHAVPGRCSRIQRLASAGT
jgi:hypothetical protein